MMTFVLRPITKHDHFRLIFTLHSQKRASCSKSAPGLLPCSHQADIRMRLHCLLRLDDKKSAASCQQACYELIVKTFIHKLDASCSRLVILQQLPTSLQILSYINSDCNLMKSTDLLQLVDNLHQTAKIYNLQQVCGVFGCAICLKKNI